MCASKCAAVFPVLLQLLGRIEPEQIQIRSPESSAESFNLEFWWESGNLYRMPAHAIMLYNYVDFKATNTKWKYIWLWNKLQWECERNSFWKVDNYYVSIECFSEVWPRKVLARVFCCLHNDVRSINAAVK